MAPSSRQHRASSAPRAIALVGIDGSGKTTQAHRLAGLLTANGTPATYRQNAGGRRWLGRLAGRLGRRDPQELLGRTGLVLVESVLRWLAIARALLRSAPRGRVAVMDRYSFCQYASIRVHGGRRWEWLARALYRVFPAPDVTFLLDTDPMVAYVRIEARGTDHESLDFLASSAAAYRSLPEFGKFVVIDANLTPDEVTAAILAHLADWSPSAGRRSVGAPVGSAPMVPVAVGPATVVPPQRPVAAGQDVDRIATRTA